MPKQAKAAPEGTAVQDDAVPESGVAEEQAPLLTLEDIDADGSIGDDMAVVASNDEWAFRRADRLTEKSRDRRGDSDRKTEGEVFDKGTLMTLHKMLLHGVLRSLDFPISTGKEANVFRGTTPQGGYVAVKIFRTNTSTFKHVLQYIQGDERFEGVSGDKRALVHAWTKKEFRNLVRAREVGVRVPDPIKSLNNVLIMEYLGVRQGPWPTLKAATVDDSNVQAICDQVVDDYVALYNQADLIHADLSEYNVMLEGHGGPVGKQRARIIDIGQAVLKNHPMAQEFLQRDVRNIVSYFTRKGVEITAQEILGRLKHERTMSKERSEERESEDDDELGSVVVRTPKAKPAQTAQPTKPLPSAKPGRGKRKARQARGELP